MRTTTAIVDEMYEEDYIQDLLFLQQAEYDKERELINSALYHPIGKRIFSNKIRFKNRRNNHRFVKRNMYYPYNKLPF